MAAKELKEQQANQRKPGQQSTKDTGPVGIYKSEFLRVKVEQQQEKRKRDRKAGVGQRSGQQAGSPRGAGTAGSATGGTAG